MRKVVQVSLALLWLGCTGRYVRETTQEVVEATPARVERGDYIVNQLASCGACHTLRESGSLVDPESTTGFLAGGNVMEDKGSGFSLWIPNITGDVETGVGGWTDDQLMRGIRDGVRPDGSFMFPVMPYSSYQYMSDEDVRAVVAYLRSAPKVKQTRPRQQNKLPFPLKMAVGMGVMMHKPAKDVPSPTRADPVKYGEYIMRLGHCVDCHSLGGTGARGPDDPTYMGGSTAPFDDPRVGKVWAPNLTPDPETGIGRYTDAQVKTTLKTGKRLDGRAMVPPMSPFIPHLSGMTDDDMSALIAYLRSLKPVKNKVPERELLPEMKKQIGE